ncbi:MULTISPECIES: Gfo/Idh/MocA family protein [unclassified Paenibacillus]|uniref:Gfo/Idh/MocA family protein n=1 Tax=unclassified Paenibacillus TaxID=185978 RepID=UPI00362E488F
MGINEGIIRFGLIGCGINGLRQHAELLSEIPGVQLVAVCDEVEEKAKAAAAQYQTDYYTHYEDMLNRSDIDVITISLPSGLHADVAVACAKAGKHALVEKPMDITLVNADRMIAAFRSAGKKLSIISQHRFDPAIVWVKEKLAAGKFGRLILGTAAVNWYRTQEYYDSGEWRGTWALDGGGALMNQSIHTIDLLQHLFGPVEEIHAYTDLLGHERIEVEDVAVATLRFRSGAIGTIVGTTCAYPGLKTRLEIFGKNGTAIIEKDKLVYSSFRDEAEAVSSEDAGGETEGASKPEAISVKAHRLQIEDMADAVRNDRDPAITGEEGRKALEIILAIYRSAQEGKPIKLPLEA